MRALKVKVMVPASHEVVVRLPDDFPAGEAEMVITPATAPAPALDPVARLEEWLATLPPAPTVPLSAFDRSELYR